MLMKGMQSYPSAQSTKSGHSDDRALDLYAEAFLKGFRVSSELAAKMKSQEKSTHREGKPVDTYGRAFVGAFEEARMLKKALETQGTSRSNEVEKLLQALERFIKAGAGVDRTETEKARLLAIAQATSAIERALATVRETTPDNGAQLETLAEIEKAVKDMRSKVQGRQGN
jgi:hypothetical protein